MWTCASRKISGPALVLAALLTGCMGTLITDETSGSNPHDPTEGEGDKSDRSSEPVTLPGGLRLAGTPEYHRFVRLTHEQWDNAVRDVFGLPATDGWSSGFVPDPPAGKFHNNEKALYVSNTLRTDYQRVAETVAQSVASDPGALARFGTADDPSGFVRSLGRTMFRRPLTADEEARYGSLFSSGKDFYENGDDFADGARIVIETMLQSPHFLYRVELTPAGERLSGFELATKLSFLLRNTTPDAALLDAAEAGELDSDEKLAALASQMLSDSTASAVLEQFHAELFGLRRYSSILKDTSVFPAYSEAFNDIVLEADRLFFRRMFEGGFGLRGILTSNLAYVDSTTAPIYGVTAFGSGFTEVTLDESRPGFLTRLGFLAYNATMRDPDPIHRGVDINNRLLCVTLSPPPGEIPALPDYVPGQTNRERVTAHTGEGSCAGCHNNVINPLGFALENFDAIGQMRSTDNGKPVDTTGEYNFNDGSKSFDGITELVSLIGDSLQAHGCYAANLTEFVLGHDLASNEATLVTELQDASLDDDLSIQNILLHVIRSPQFAMAQGGTQ